MRMRCEKKRQKDATQQQAELTAEQIAERKAKADAFAEVSHSTWLLLQFIAPFEDKKHSVFLLSAKMHDSAQIGHQRGWC